MAQTSERMRMTPRVILILMQVSSRARRHKTLAQKVATTVVNLKDTLPVYATPPVISFSKACTKLQSDTLFFSFCLT